MSFGAMNAAAAEFLCHNILLYYNGFEKVKS